MNLNLPAKRPHFDHSRVTKDIVDIFKPDPGCETDATSQNCPRSILIEGAPGISKTVLAKEIAYHWAIGKILAETDLLFLSGVTANR